MRATLRAMFCDIAIQYDPARRRCDLVFDGVGLAIDYTALTPMLISLMTDGRAGADDVLPDGRDDDPAPAFNWRRGSALDALDGQGRRIGWAGWIYERSKQSEDVRQGLQACARTSLSWIDAERGVPTYAVASYPRPGFVLIEAACGALSVSLQMPAGT